MQIRVSPGQLPDPFKRPHFAGTFESGTGAVLGFLVPPDSGPLIIDLELDDHVYLHEARLALCRTSNAVFREVAYRNRSHVAWRHLAVEPGSGLVLTWTAIAEAAPDTPYQCRVTLRDSRTRLLEAVAGTSNPVRIGRRIGSADQPADHGQISIALLPPTQGLPV